MRIDIRDDGSIHVQEVIVFVAGAAEERHGILREIRVRHTVDFFRDRLFPVSDEWAFASSDTTPDEVDVSDSGRNKVIRIGDPDQTITGRHTYTIDYDVEAAMTAFPGHDELNWDAIPTGWETPIDRGSVIVTAPGRFTRVTCYAGSEGSRKPCKTASGAERNRADFSSGPLGAKEGTTVVLALPKGVVAVPPPILQPSGPALALAWGTGTLVPGVAAVALVGGVFERRRRRIEGAPAADQSADGLRPAQMGILAEGRVKPSHVTATLVDLAVRGHLSIEPAAGEQRWWERKQTLDWKLTGRHNPRDPLLGYERELLSAMFRGRSEVRMSEARKDLSLKRVKEEMGADAMRRGWFASAPHVFRDRYEGIGGWVAIMGVALTAFGGLGSFPPDEHPVWVSFPILGVGAAVVLLGGLVLLWSWAYRNRTPRGDAALAQVVPFRRQVESAAVTPGGLAGDGGLDRYLPYAVAFDATDRWTSLLESRGVPMAWFHGPYGWSGSGEGGIGGFVTSASGAVSSGSGFGGGGGAGGGGGGGGGGGW